MTMLTRKRTMAFKTETVIGTPESLAAADGVVNAYDTEIQGEFENQAREAQGSFDRLMSIPGKHQGTLTFKTDIEQSSAGVPAYLSTLFAACGYVASAGVITPRTETPGTNVKTLTMGVYTDGIFKSIAGAMGTFKINYPTGLKIFIEWEFSGVWQAPTDVAIISPVYPTDIPTRFASSEFTYDSKAQCVENMVFDAGNNVVMRECSNTVAGLVSAIITDMEPQITINPEAQLVATQDRYGFWMTPEEKPLSCEVTSPSGSKFTLLAPKAQPLTVAETDRDGIFVDDVTLTCNKNGANKDQSVSLTFTDSI